MVTDRFPEALAMKPTRSLRRPALLLLASAVALSACGGVRHEPATMLSSAPGYTARPIDGARPVEMIAITPANVGQYAMPAGAAAGWSYRLGIGDVVQLFVVDEPEMTVPGGTDAGYLVEADGMIQLPFLGRVPANDQTVPALRAEIAQRLTRYIARPQVDVRVTGFNARHVAVVGDVARPSRQSLTTTPLTVIDAINAAGGFAQGRENAAVTLIRNGAEQRVDMRGFMTQGLPTPVLQDGDVLRVGGWAARSAGPAPARAVQLYHADMPPRTIALGAAPVSLAQVVGTGGPAAPGQGVYVLRAAPGGRVQALTLDAGAALDPALGGQLMLQAGDSVVLGAVGATMDPAQQFNALTPALRAMAM